MILNIEHSLFLLVAVLGLDEPTMQTKVLLTPVDLPVGVHRVREESRIKKERVRNLHL